MCETHVKTKQLIDLIENDAQLYWNGVEKFVDQLKRKATNRFCLLIFIIIIIIDLYSKQAMNMDFREVNNASKTCSRRQPVCAMECVIFWGAISFRQPCNKSNP